MAKLPETIIAGYQKCGTTAIYHYLEKHPGVGVAQKNPETANIMPFLYNDAAYPKELNFFGNELLNKAGIDWYKSHFTEEIPSVDVNPNYLLNQPPGDKNSLIRRTLDRIEASGFSGNFIVVLRNPIDRSFSAYNHYKQDLPRSKEVMNDQAQTLCILIHGSCRAKFVDTDQEVFLKNPGDYIRWGPDAPHEFEYITDCLIITVRW